MSRKKVKSKRFFRLKRISIPVLVLIPLSLLVFPAYDLINSRRIIFPVEDIQDKLSIYNDRGFKGNSVIDLFSCKDRIIDLRYTLKEGANSPMVFIMLSTGTAEYPLDVSSYESVLIKVRESTNGKIQIYMKTYLPGISSPESKDASTLRHNAYVLKLLPGVQEYTIDFDKFRTANWWLSMMNLSSSELPEEKFDKLVSFDMQFNSGGSDSMLDKPQKVVIESIMFRRSFSFLSRLILWVLGFFYSGFVIFIVIQKFLYPGLVIPKQKTLEVASYRERDLARIREYIKLHYCDPDISTRKLYKFLGIPPEKVFALVLSEYGLSFKQLVNKMRIEEAKRLLRESDLRITDIAMNIGFNDLSYFNRLFKKHVRMTPSDFRDNAAAR